MEEEAKEEQVGGKIVSCTDHIKKKFACDRLFVPYQEECNILEIFTTVLSYYHENNYGFLLITVYQRGMLSK